MSTSIFERSSYIHDEILSIECTNLGAENVTIQYFDENGDLYSQSGGICNRNLDPNGYFEQNLPGLVDGVRSAVVTFDNGVTKKLCAVESTENTFLSCTTPTDLLGSVTRGVQDTGANLWPLFVFLGVAVSFWIGWKLGDFILDSITKEKRKVATAADYELTPADHKYLADLEFKREYGQKR